MSHNSLFVDLAERLRSADFLLDAVDLPSDLAKKLPRYPHLPVTLLGRLAIDQSSKGQRLGQFLLLDALYRSLQAAAFYER